LEKNHKIAIIGLGYVGLPLAVSFSKYYKTIGYDISENRIEELKKSIDRNIDADINELDSLHFTYNLSELKDSNMYIIYDPLMNNNNSENPFLKDKKYDAIILAVAHKQFYNYTINDFNLISKEKLVLLDIKGIYDFSTWTL